jgi:uncharacterized protein YggE
MLAVETRGDSTAVAIAENAQRTARIRAALTRAGVPATSITVAPSGYFIGPDRMPPRPTDTTPVFRQVVRNTIRVDGIDAARANEMIELAVTAGATNANVMEQSPATATAVERDRALGEAAANARRNAEIMARALGGTLGELVEVSNVQPFPPEAFYEAQGGRFPRFTVSVVGRWRLLFAGR